MTDRVASLVVEKGIADRANIILDRSLLVLGKSSSVDANIDNQYVSRRHFQVRCQDELFFISDLDSTNGTFINGERLKPQEERRLKDRDLIGLAEEQVVFRFSDPVKTMTFTSFPPDRDAKPPAADLIVDPGSRDVWAAGEKLDPPLSRKEFNILEVLYLNRGNAVSRDEIAASGWPERPDGDVTPEEIDQYIRRLRRRVEENSSDPKLIVTMRGYGYRIL